MSVKVMEFNSLFVAGALFIGATVHASGNINTSGAICQNFNAAQALDIDYLTTGVRNLNTAARPVICSLPRSPLPAGATPRFFVDGHNNANTCTSCTLTMYQFNGTGVTTQSFANCAPATTPLDWSQLVVFPMPIPPADTFYYASLLCTIPGSGAGLIYGVTALQP